MPRHHHVHMPCICSVMLAHGVDRWVQKKKALRNHVWTEKAPKVLVFTVPLHRLAVGVRRVLDLGHHNSTGEQGGSPTRSQEPLLHNARYDTTEKPAGGPHAF